MDAPAWHSLFAPLPGDVIPRRAAVAPPETLAKPEGAAIAGWAQLTIELSAGETGLRVAMVVLDADGKPISASDHVLHRSVRADGRVEYTHDNIGGRLEADGRFFGTRWHGVTVETADGEQVQNEHTPSEPSAEDIAALKSLVEEIRRRAGR